MTILRTFTLVMVFIGTLPLGCRTAKTNFPVTNRAGLLTPGAGGIAQNVSSGDRGSDATADSEPGGASPISETRIQSALPTQAEMRWLKGDEAGDGFAPGAVQHVDFESHEAAGRSPGSTHRDNVTGTFPAPQADAMSEVDRDSKPLPIDLAATLQLSGADTWQVELARQKSREAAASYQLARLAWVPDLNLGIAFNHHDGELQATDGEVAKISRTSLFVGGGGAWGAFPLAGGAGGPPRLAVSVSLADAWFGPLVARQEMEAAELETESVRLQMQRSAGSAYLNLVDAVARYAASMEDLRDAEHALASINAFVDAGKGAAVDVDQMQIFVRDRQQAVIRLESEVVLAANRLANAINLDLTQLNPALPLVPAETVPAPLALVEPSLGPMELVRQALAHRPELTELQARMCAADHQRRAEQWRPLLPHLQVGASAGAFGGGTGSTVDQLDGRSDFDVIMAWQLKNLGAGNHRLYDRQDARRAQLAMTYYTTRDQITREVLDAWTALNSASQQLELSVKSLDQARSLVEQTVSRVRELQSGPLDLIQALTTLSRARQQHILSMTEFNQYQLELLLAVGSDGNHGLE